MSMKILVQDPNSLEYLTQNREWSARVAEAKEFNDLEQAENFAKGHTFRDFQVVIHFNFVNVSVPIFSAGVWTVTKPAPAPLRIRALKGVS
jgi:hypothetical protein